MGVYLFFELYFGIVLLEFGEAIIFVAGYIFKFFAELFLHFVPEFDFLLVLDVSQSDSLELVLSHYLHLRDLAG